MTDISCIPSLEKACSRRFYRWRGYAASLTGNVTDAEEVIQEAIARTLRANPRLPSEQDAHHYILAALRTVAFQLFEQRKRLRPVEPRELERRQEPTSNPLRMLLDAESREQQHALAQKAYNAMQDLEPHLQQVIELLVLREPPMKLREVAAIQGAPISTVHSLSLIHIWRCRRELWV